MRASLVCMSVPCVLLGVGACGARTDLEAHGRSAGGPQQNPAEVCAKLEAGLEPVQVDVFFLFDASGSMTEATVEGISKWQALTQAMWAFLFDPAAAGLRIGIGFFPQHDFQVPAFCAGGFGCVGSDDCVPYGVCVPSGATMCSTDAQCPNDGDHCQLSGYCSLGGECDPSVGGCPQGECNPIGYCASHTKCDTATYRITGLSTLPDDAFGVANAIEAHPLDGFTPTLPAFRGVMESAIDWQTEHPDDLILTILATDGFPTLCDPSLQESGIDAGIANLANVAGTGAARGIRSYVLGVFNAQEEQDARERLDTIALAGGTGSAHVVRTDHDVAGQIVHALNELRLENSCGFLLPPGIEQLDLARLEVSMKLEGSEVIELILRSHASECDSASGGFYFDPPAPALPQRIHLCPASCVLRPVSLVVTCADAI